MPNIHLIERNASSQCNTNRVLMHNQYLSMHTQVQPKIDTSTLHSNASHKPDYFVSSNSPDFKFLKYKEAPYQVTSDIKTKITDLGKLSDRIGTANESDGTELVPPTYRMSGVSSISKPKTLLYKRKESSNSSNAPPTSRSINSSHSKTPSLN